MNNGDIVRSSVFVFNALAYLFITVGLGFSAGPACKKNDEPTAQSAEDVQNSDTSTLTSASPQLPITSSELPGAAPTTEEAPAVPADSNATPPTVGNDFAASTAPSGTEEVVLPPAPSNADLIAPASLEAADDVLFSFGEGQGTAFADDNNGYRGQLDGAQWLLQGKGIGLSNGIASISAMRIGGPNGLTVRVVLSGGDADEWGGIVFQPTATCGNPYQRFGLQLVGGKRLNFALGLNGWSIDLPAEVDLPSGSVEVVAMYDGRVMQLFQNGQLVGIKWFTGELVETSEPVLLGRGGCGERFRGVVEELQIWNRAIPYGIGQYNIVQQQRDETLALPALAVSAKDPHVHYPSTAGSFPVAIAGRRLNEFALQKRVLPVKQPDSGSFQIVAEFSSPLDSSDYYDGKFINAAQASYNLNNEVYDGTLADYLYKGYAKTHGLPSRAVPRTYKIRHGDVIVLSGAFHMESILGFVDTPLGFKSGLCHTANALYGVMVMLDSAANKSGAHFVAVNQQFHAGSYWTYSLVPGVPFPGITMYYVHDPAAYSLDLSYRFDRGQAPTDTELTLKVIPLPIDAIDYALIGQVYSNQPLF